VILQQLASKIEFAGPDDCWRWTGATAKGYGVVRVGGRKGRIEPAHRVMYEICVGPIPDGLQIDHTCHNADLDCPGGVTCPHRRCVNPRHLEPATQQENILRGGRSASARNAVKTHCDHGHEFTPDNTYIHRRSNRPPGRECRACTLDRQKKSRRRAA
jgi:hypothetical protein